jgi:hypothetical protein
MPLGPSQQAKASAWLKTRLTGCHNCHGKSFSMGDIIAGTAVAADGGIAIGGQITPMVPVICGSCAYVHLFAAVPMGLP